MKALLFILMVLMSPLVHAWQNVSGKIISIYMYPNRDIVLVRLDNDGIHNPDCTNDTLFAISSAVPEARRNSLISALFMARASNIVVELAYYKEGICEVYNANTSFRTIKRIIF